MSRFQSAVLQTAKEAPMMLRCDQGKEPDMDKNKKTKKASGTPKSVKQPSDYKARETAGKESQTDAMFHKTPGKGKSGQRKG
jgi:hypothetical protein